MDNSTKNNKPIKRLCEIREFNGWTQKQAAEHFQVSYSYYVKVEQGAVKAGRGFIERFAELLPYEDVSIFFGGGGK